jgi:hypothetical protein
MEDALKDNPSARVRRRLKAGAPRSRETITGIQALQILIDQADKAHRLMREEGLSPDDIHIRMVFVDPEAEKIGFKPLPPAALAAPFFEYFASAPVDCIGIWWFQKDPKTETGEVSWITQLAGGDKAGQLMLKARALLLRRPN